MAGEPAARNDASADESAFADRIDDLVAEARVERERFDPPPEPPDGDRALAYLREGLGPTVSVYIEARTADRPVRFSQRELDALHEATNHWLALYARSYGVAYDPEFTVREVAELVVDTHDIADTAQLLTGVPSR